MKDNLYPVALCNSLGHVRERRELRINDRIVPGHTIVGRKNNVNLTPVKFTVVKVENGVVYGRIVKGSR